MPAEEAEFHALRDCLESLPEKSRMLIDGRYFDDVELFAGEFVWAANDHVLEVMPSRYTAAD